MTTESDRELLELAAKAAGYTLVWGDNYIVDGDNIDCTDLPYVRSDQQDEADWHWNPLTDDGDALRLAVRLRMAVYPPEAEGDDATVSVPEDGPWVCEAVKSDPYTATRRAIVRAAAEIARATHKEGA